MILILMKDFSIFNHEPFLKKLYAKFHQQVSTE